MAGAKLSTCVEPVSGMFGPNVAFEVPRFQHGYSWEQDAVERLWEGLASTFDAVRNAAGPARDAQRLLGPMVVVPAPGGGMHAMSVLDGQQRLATLTLLFCAARDIIAEDAEAAETDADTSAMESMIENTRIDGSHAGWKVSINGGGDLLREIQQRKRGRHPTQLERLREEVPPVGPAGRLRNCYIFLHERMSEALASRFGDDKEGYRYARLAGDAELRKRRMENARMLASFVRCTRDYNFVLVMEAGDEDRAFQVFESLDGRGRAEAKSDLIKKLVIGKAGADGRMQGELARRWDAALERIGPFRKADEFILESFRSRHFPEDGATAVSLYDLIDGMIPDGDPAGCMRYLDELECDSETVAAMCNPSSYLDAGVRAEMDALAALDAAPARVPALAAFRKWGTGKYCRMIVAGLVKFFFKFRVVRRRHMGEVERAMAKIAEAIETGGGPGRVLDEMRAHDEHGEFLDRFEGAFAKRPGRGPAKYALQQITLHLRLDGEAEHIGGLALEHVLPHDHAGWDRGRFFAGYAGAQDMDGFVARLGNLTLLKAAVGPDAGGRGFAVMSSPLEGPGGVQARYGGSDLAINEKTVCDKDEWTAAAVVEREKLFVKYAEEIWRM